MVGIVSYKIVVYLTTTSAVPSQARSLVNTDVFAPPVNTLSVVIGACRVIPEYSHFLAKLQALACAADNPPCVNYTNITLFHTISHNAAAHASSQLQEYTLWWVVSCLLQMIFDHSQPMQASTMALHLPGFPTKENVVKTPMVRFQKIWEKEERLIYYQYVFMCSITVSNLFNRMNTLTLTIVSNNLSLNVK